MLVIDDERSVRMALTRYFERGGWEVRQAEDGSEALVLLADPAASTPSIHEFIRRTTRPVLEKPFELGDLAALVQRVTAGR